ncbi:phosphonoacetaldehyde hydrolase [Lysinibacillus sp. LZ02]|uniref:phosphonoacetaldehyde hydrolase n=1 Tax=Lysinibacillus sp. LZ02 TaxID=3420668 RepID=UPI003D36C147
MKAIEGIILDWAGTTVDFGCMAPVNVFVEIFEDAGVEVTIDEARKPMGMLKIDHIRTMLQMPRIEQLWQEVHGSPFTEQDVEALYVKFEESLMKTLVTFTDPIDGVVEIVTQLRSKGLKIGSTTGYTQMMMDVVVPNAKAKGYSPDFYITPDATNSFGRPYPYMIYRNMEQLQLQAVQQVVKVGDTISDINEALHAGVWAVGVVIGSSEMGLSQEEYEALTTEQKEQIIEATAQKFKNHGAHYTIRTMNELPALIDKINERLNS